MIVEKFEDNWSWLEARRGKITGSRLADVITKRGTGYKVGVYELIAEKLGISADGEDERERGHRLEPEAIERLIKETSIPFKTEKVLWKREEDEDIALSPDAFTEDLTVAGEAKCLSSAKHIKALIEQKVPEDYEYQALQYFIVNERLEKLYFCFYDPRLYTKDFFYLVITREEKLEEIDEYLAYEAKLLAFVREQVNAFTF